VGSLFALEDRGISADIDACGVGMTNARAAGDRPKHSERHGGHAVKKYKFKAKIDSAGGGGAYVLFPYDVEQEFGTRGRVAVKATFNGTPYAGSLVKYGHPQHMLHILKSIREQIGKGPGDTIEVVLWKDDEVRTVEIPAAFKAMLKKEGLLAGFEKLSYTHRKEYCRWIEGAKKEETRQNRMAKAVVMMRKGVKTPG
jgi:hypothetical protein